MIMKRNAILTIGCLILLIFGGWSLALAYEVAEVVNGGTIRGHIGFQGTPPAPRKFEVQKNPEVCGSERWLTKVDVHDGFLKGAVVLLRDVEKGKAFEAQSFKGKAPGEGEFRHDGGEKLSLKVQAKSCNFGPFTGVVPFQESVKFTNQDSMKHTVHTYSVRGRKTAILRSIIIRDLFPDSPLEEEIATEKLKKDRVLALTCDRHDFMENWLYVVENPYFSISDKDGTYTIDQVPPGNYELVVWHPVLGLQEQNVNVAPNSKVDIDFELSKK